jgi:hypothetical protein
MHRVCGRYGGAWTLRQIGVELDVHGTRSAISYVVPGHYASLRPTCIFHRTDLGLLAVPSPGDGL